MSRPTRGAADLLRTVGLMADGPVTWGRPISGRGPGLYLVELASPPAVAPIDMAKIGEWLARTPGLRVDGVQPSGKELAARLAAFWLPSEPVVFAAGTDRSIGGRVASLVRHIPGDRQPHPDGQWLHVLFGLPSARIWWASTDAPDEALDAVLTAFADGLDPAARASLPDQDVVLPFASVRGPTGERKTHGITGAVAPAPAPPPAVPGHVTDVPPGDAEGAEASTGRGGLAPRTVAPPPGRAPRRRPDDGSAPARRSSPAPVSPRRAERPAAPRATRSPAGSTSTRTSTRTTTSRGGRTSREIPPTEITPDGLVRLEAEHDELTKVRRPGVVARIRTAKELGDLKENAEYHAAREEQSFLEGRVQAIEAILRNHVVIETPGVGATTIHLGTTVTIADADGEFTWTIVGPTEANPAEGRISISSPVGAALLGRGVGQDVPVRTPRGQVVYRVVAIE